MPKRRIEIFVTQATEEVDAKVGYEIWELTGHRTYTQVGGDNDLDLDALGSAVSADLTALDE